MTSRIRSRTTATARRSSSAASPSTASRCSTSTAASAPRRPHGGRGFGSMPLGNVWSFPSQVLRYDDTLGAMKALAERIAALTGDCQRGRPSHRHRRTPWSRRTSRPPPRCRAIAEPGRADPASGTLVAASPFDAALHDAFGKAPRPATATTPTAPTSCPTTSATTSAPSSAASTSTGTSAASRSRACRCITSSAPSTRSRTRTSTQPIGDGLPETLAEWIRYNGLTHLKIKLNGDDLAWDVERVLRVDRVAAAAQRAARRRAVVLLARLQRALPERRLPAGVPAPTSRERAPAASSASSTSSSRRPAT